MHLYKAACEESSVKVYVYPVLTRIHWAIILSFKHYHQTSAWTPKLISLSLPLPNALASLKSFR